MRINYGWEEEYMFDLIDANGFDWLNKQFRYCRQDEYQRYNILMNIVPFARTPLSKEVGKAMIKAEKAFGESLMKVFTPWRNAHEERRKAFRKRYGVKPGEIAVVYGAGEAGLAKDLAGGADVKIVKG